MAILTFQLTPRAGGDPVKVDADSGDVYFWEKTHKGKTLNTLLESQSMTDLYEVAHVAAQRLDVFTDTNIDAFARAYVLDFEQDDDADPTR